MRFFLLNHLKLYTIWNLPGGAAMTNNDFDKLIKSASDKLGSSPDELKRSLEKKDLTALSSVLTKADKHKLRQVLADKELMTRLKSAGSPEEVMKLLGSMK